MTGRELVNKILEAMHDLDKPVEFSYQGYSGPDINAALMYNGGKLVIRLSRPPVHNTPAQASAIDWGAVLAGSIVHRDTGSRRDTGAQMYAALDALARGPAARQPYAMGDMITYHDGPGMEPRGLDHEEDSCDSLSCF